MKRIILEGGKLPQFEGQWTVGEVLAMADSLARWVQALTVSAPEVPEKQQPEPAKVAK